LGDQPSAKAAGKDDLGFPVVDLTHPVESVSWERCLSAVFELGLTLPTEAQWSLAAGEQGGLKFGGSAQPEWAAARASHRDLSYARVANADLDLFLHDDGYFDHRPVDAGPPNFNGLHDMLGNVKEWCLDWFCEGLSEPSLIGVSPGTGELLPEYPANRSIRGGSFLSAVDDLRLSRRRRAQPSHSGRDIGLRPACRAMIRE
jgi:sulfatase modifying factor 1